MCINFLTPDPRRLAEHFDVDTETFDWPAEVWQDGLAPIIVGSRGGARVILASFGLIPRRHLPAKSAWTTMNARSETLDARPAYRAHWLAGRRCLVPMQGFYEPCYESGKAVRWRVGRADGALFAAAGVWRPWKEDNGAVSHAFTLITVNADHHPLLNRLHRPGDEKRSLAIIGDADRGAWLGDGPPAEVKRLWFLPPADQLVTGPAPARVEPPGPRQGDLFD
ncbi:SOS response-associated peptidase [Paludibacterium paludis]|uniref:Abasic site processing protein n=1 Tax=Paludibacterium paludis TaxID=1225769 RepID=A0A918P589_9NEIS|nr:SOS response-associated peptidase family protein [Paludibacterium paludis]GGY24867.1 DUF159 family protein [Paludibacterium paludis]